MQACTISSRWILRTPAFSAAISTGVRIGLGEARLKRAAALVAGVAGHAVGAELGVVPEVLAVLDQFGMIAPVQGSCLWGA
ncbi:MAG: hypothetical protein MZW92_68265 [Comamonadaceae bacterium]|nr:hypothetical protein [Comamonadaceae bacterium]